MREYLKNKIFDKKVTYSKSQMVLLFYRKMSSGENPPEESKITKHMNKTLN